MKYAVHLYTQVHVMVTGVQADTVQEAMEKAEGLLDLHDLLDNKSVQVSKYDLGNGVEVSAVEWAESAPNSFLVDRLLVNGEVDYENSRWFGPDGLPLIDGKTTVEQKAKKADLAGKFMQELLISVETLVGIADEHGARTLADLMYLHNAILSGGFIDHYPGESKVLEIAQGLPSGNQWAEYIKVEYMDTAESPEVPLEKPVQCHYRVGVDRKGFRSCTITVQATSPEDAERQAHALAGDHEFAGEHHAEYSTSFVAIDKADVVFPV